MNIGGYPSRESYRYFSSCYDSFSKRDTVTAISIPLIFKQEDMKNEIKIFNNPEFGRVRTINEEGNIMFSSTDVAKALGYVNPRKAILTHCKSAGVTTRSVGVQTGSLIDGTPIMQNVNVKFMDEGNVYRLIVSSKLPKAEMFEKWLFDEVLPSIRKTGGYMVARDDESPEEIMARALLVAQETLKRRDERLKQLETENERQRTTIEEKTRENHNMMGKLIEQAPDVKYVKSTLNAPTTYTTQIAKELGMRSAVTLHQRLKDMKVMFSQSGSWMMTAPYCDKGYTKTRTSTGENNGGGTWSKTITVWTEKGRKFLHELLNVELKDEPAQV